MIQKRIQVSIIILRKMHFLLRVLFSIIYYILYDHLQFSLFNAYIGVYLSKHEATGTELNCFFLNYIWVDNNILYNNIKQIHRAIEFELMGLKQWRIAGPEQWMRNDDMRVLVVRIWCFSFPTLSAWREGEAWHNRNNRTERVPGKMQKRELVNRDSLELWKGAVYGRQSSLKEHTAATARNDTVHGLPLISKEWLLSFIIQGVLSIVLRRVLTQ